MQRKATAIWQGGLQDGKGTLSTQSGVLDAQQYSFKTRFEDGKGTNPEELIAAAHAGCFSMALSMLLGQSELTAEKIETRAAVTLDKQGEGFAITKIHLDLKARVPGTDQANFEKIANDAKQGCPVSQVLNAQISLDATLES